MKIIGKGSDDKYIAEVGHHELEKFLGLYYGKLKRLEIGSEIDLGKGYQYEYDISRAMKTTQEFIEANAKVVEAILNGMKIVSITSREENKCA